MKGAFLRRSIYACKPQKKIHKMGTAADHHLASIGQKDGQRMNLGNAERKVV